MKIRTKYLGFLCLFIFIFTGLILGVVLHMKRLNSKNMKEMLNYQNENEMVYSLALSLNKLIMPPNDYLIHGDEEERYTFEDLVADVNSQFEILEGKYYSTRIMAEERELLARLKDKYTLVIFFAEKILDIPNPIGNEEGVHLMKEMDLLIDNMTEDAKELNREARLNTLVKVEAIDAQFHRYMIIVLCILVVIIVSAGLYGLFLTKGIVIPIRRFVEYTGLVGEGNFDRRLDIKTGDEIGTLAVSLNWMTQRLKTSHDTIKEHADKLEEMVRERTKALKDAMEELQELNIKIENAKNDWEATFDSISDIISIHDSDFNITRCNQALARKFNTKPEVLIGKKCYEVFHGSDEPCTACPFVRCKESLKPETEEIECMGSFYTISCFPRLDEAGKLNGFVHIARDIAERKEAEQKVKHGIEKLKMTVEGIINALALTVEQRDPYTAGHQQRVSLLSSAIADEMGLSDDQIEGIRMAGIVHDIGKMHIPAEILSRPGKLDENEFNIVKSHVQVGYDILKGIEFPWPVADIVHQHHESMDGSGYPLGLSNGDILMEARILCVADVVEAMASHRPYRPALGMDIALEEISKGKGTRYDSGVVDACLKVIKEKGFGFDAV